jgi:hypothetical protein
MIFFRMARELFLVLSFFLSRRSMAVSSARRWLPSEDAQRPLAASFPLTRATAAAAAGSQLVVQP